jgi:hypothetical protein
MKHDILGEVERTDGHPFDGVATIRYGSRDIKVGISRDDQPFETTLNLAAEVSDACQSSTSSLSA